MDTAKSWLLYTHTTADGTTTNIGQKLVRGAITNSTTLTFDRDSTGQTIDLTWYVVAYDDHTVQKGTQAFTTARDAEGRHDHERHDEQELRGGRRPAPGRQVGVHDRRQPGRGLDDARADVVDEPAHHARPDRLATADMGWFVVSIPTPAITVSPTSGLTPTEAGGTATFTVVLASRPTANVTFSLSSNDTTEGTVSPSSLTFTSANWSTAQTVTVTGVNDFLDDGNIAFSIVTAAATSSDAGYSGLDPSDVSATTTDDDVSGFTVTPTSGLTTTEAGGTATFSVVLTAQPTANVSTALTSSDTTEGTVSPASLTFTTANWNTAQTVTVTGATTSWTTATSPTAS